MSGVLIIKSFIFTIAVLAALDFIVKGNSLKPDFHELFTKEKIFRKQRLFVRDMAIKLHLQSFYHSFHLVQEDFK